MKRALPKPLSCGVAARMVLSRSMAPSVGWYWLDSPMRMKISTSSSSV